MTTYGIVITSPWWNLKLHARKPQYLDENILSNILKNAIVYGIDIDVLCKLKASLIFMRHRYYTHILNSRTDMYWFPFIASDGLVYALGFNREELSRACLLYGYDTCPNITILNYEERNFSNYGVRKTREETRIYAIKNYLKRLKNYGKHRTRNTS